MSPSRSALLIATDTYDDARLRKLSAPPKDVEDLARLLGDPAFGRFDVEILSNRCESDIRKRIETFFKNRSSADLLLLYISGHGLKDGGCLYFATTDTDRDSPDSTAVSSEFVKRHLDNSASRRIVLLLDCCYAGAFTAGSKGDEGVDVRGEFDGKGRVVLTSSTATQESFEGDQVKGEASPSLFTRFVIDGIESGAADRDRDRRISVDELYDYVFEKVRAATPRQTPSKTATNVQGELVIAESPNTPVQPAELPGGLRASLASDNVHQRLGAVLELQDLLESPDPAVIAAAAAALSALTEDDSRRVSVAARTALGDAAEPAPVPLAAPPRQPDPSSHDRAGAEHQLIWKLVPERRYLLGDADLGSVVRALRELYEEEGLQTQVLTADDGVVVQGREIGKGWKAWVGMSKAMTVQLREDRSELCVKIGYASWMTKAVVGYFGIALVPLLGTTAVGVKNATHLRRRTLETIEAVGATPVAARSAG